MRDAERYYHWRGISLDDWKTLVFLARQLIKILGDKGNEFRAGDSAKEAQTAFDRTVAHDAPAIACSKGCSHCCRNFVSASPPDIFHVARYIRDNHEADFAAAFNRICAAEDNTRNVSQDVRYKEHQPCALLIDGACSVYEARPMACRGWASMDVRPCENWEDDIPVPEVFRESRPAIDHVLRAALKHHKRDKRSYELNHAVRIALEDSDSERRWLDGEDIFKDVLVDQTITAPDKIAAGEQILDALIDDAIDGP
jgi:Fe-S-cluster containining protein